MTCSHITNHKRGILLHATKLSLCFLPGRMQLPAIFMSEIEIIYSGFECVFTNVQNSGDSPVEPKE